MKTGKFLAILLFYPTLLWAEPTVTAKVSASEVGLNSTLTLAIEIAGLSNVGPAPDFSIPDFQVQRAGQTSSYQWINGQSSSLITFNYVLQPLKLGALQIPSITLSSDGKNYSTQPIPILVVQDNSSPSGDPQPSHMGELPNKSVSVPREGLKPVFITASVDTNKAYVGQQILLRVQFLRRPDFRLASQPRYSEPDMTGFLVEPLKQQEYTTTLNGAQYLVTELPYALFPTSDGDYSIGAAQVELAVRKQMDPFDPDSFFQNFFGRTESARLTTRAIPIQIRSLPKNKPINFSGSVGRFKISSKVDTEEPEAGKPFNLILTVEGVGNINAIKEPFIPQLPGFRKYETISSSKLDKEGKFIHGSKEFKILLIPQVSGPLTIPAVAFSYFNPAQNDFKTETTSPIPLQIKPGTLSPHDPDVINQVAPGSESTEGIRVVEKDIRFLKTDPIHKWRKPLLMQPWFQLSIFFPPLFSFISLIVSFQSHRKRAQPGLYRSKKAFSQATKLLAKTKKLMPHLSTETFYGQLNSALVDFLASKFGVSSSGLKWEDIEKRLNESKIDSSLIGLTRTLFDEADMARFATSSYTDQNRSDSLKNLISLLRELNKIL